jgi:hypothetical protein
LGLPSTTMKHVILCTLKSNCGLTKGQLLILHAQSPFLVMWNT